MKPFRNIFFAATVLASWPAWACDLLPLKHGVYVIDGVPCHGASYNVITSYGGGAGNSLGDYCRVAGPVTRRADTYSYREYCETSGIEHMVVTVDGDSRFKVKQDDGTYLSYRWCGAHWDPPS